jgi:hypothetical protein
VVGCVHARGQKTFLLKLYRLNTLKDEVCMARMSTVRLLVRNP